MESKTWVARFQNQPVGDSSLNLNNDEQIEETTFRDADGDKRSLWLCVRCVENQIWV